MDTPLRRLRQINEVIAERRSIADVTFRSYIEWQTKVLASFFATNAQSKKAAEQITEAANSISITGKKGGKGGQAPPTLDHLPPDDSPNAEANAERNKAKAAGGGPAAGSFEKMSAMFGGGVMRAGPQAG